VVDIWRLPKPIPISSSLTGKTEYLGNTVEVDIKSDYATNQTMNSEKAQIYIVDALINGLDAPKKNQAKFPNFDVARFAVEFTECLRK